MNKMIFQDIVPIVENNRKVIKDLMKSKGLELVVLTNPLNIMCGDDEETILKVSLTDNNLLLYHYKYSGRYYDWYVEDELHTIHENDVLMQLYKMLTA